MGLGLSSAPNFREFVGIKSVLIQSFSLVSLWQTIIILFGEVPNYMGILITIIGKS